MTDTGDQGPSTLRQLAGYLGAIAACEGVGALGAAVTVPAVKDWLPTLDQPSFQPPDWLFGPVWTVLYAMIGVSWRLTRLQPAGPARASAERWLAVQLALNALWSYLFFGRRRIDLALVDIVVLWVAIALTVTRVWRLSPRAGLLLTPYLAWVSFAGVLNASLWRRNP